MSNKGLLLKQNMTNIANAIRNNGGSILPKEYTELEYIESSETQYIDTGFKPNQDTKVEIDYNYIDDGITRHNWSVFGVNTLFVITSVNITPMLIRYNDNSFVTDITTTIRHKVLFDKNKVYNDGILIHTFTPVTFSTNYNALIFARRSTSGNVEERSKSRVYFCKIYDNNTLVRNFIPCYRNSDNEVGLYDTVNNVFYTNQGTGTFIKGPEVASQFKPREMAQGIDNLADLLRNYIPHRAVTGNPLSVDAIALKPKELAVNGDCKQNSTTGKNKFTISDYSVSWNTEEFKVLNNILTISIGSGSGGITANRFTDWTYYDFDVTKPYIFSIRAISNALNWKSGVTTNLPIHLYLLYSDGSGSTGHDYRSSINLNKDNSSSGSVQVSFAQGKIPVAYALGWYGPANQLENNQSASYYLQLEEGSTATAYEPYTNGASPNPDYPQEVRTVKAQNLFNLNNSYSRYGVDYIFNNSTLTMNGTSTNDGGFIILGNTPLIAKLRPGTYILSCAKIEGTNSGTANVVIRNLDSNVNLIDRAYSDGSTYMFTLISETNIGFNFYQLGSGRVYSNYKVNIQLARGTQALPYMPYGTIALKKTGKNLFDKDSNIITGQHYLADGTTETYGSDFIQNNYCIVKPNTTYSVNASVGGWVRVIEYDKNYNVITSHIPVSLGQSFTTNSLCKYVRFSASNGQLNSLQIEEGSTATAYEPYKSVIIPFTVGNTEFCKIGTVADKLWVNLRTGQYGKTGNIGKVVLDGSENWTLSGTRFYTRDFANTVKAGASSINNYLKSADTGYNDNALNIGGNKSLFLRSSIITPNDAVEELTSWLTTHNITLYYELEVPTTETLGTLSATDLANLRLYAGVNNIELQGYEDNATEPVIELDYYYDYNELTEALLELGGE